MGYERLRNRECVMYKTRNQRRKERLQRNLFEVNSSSESGSDTEWASEPRRQLPLAIQYEVASLTPAGEEDADYEVEKVLLKRYQKGKLQYYLAWKGFEAEEDSWQPAENLHCKELIDKFNETEKKWSKVVKKIKEWKEDEKAKQLELEKSLTVQAKPSRGFARGLEAESIIGYTEALGEILYLVKWKGMDGGEDLVSAFELRKKAPQLLEGVEEPVPQKLNI